MPGKKFGLQQGLVNVSGNFFLNKNGLKNQCNRQSTPNGDFLSFQFLDFSYVDPSELFWSILCDCEQSTVSTMHVDQM